MKSNLLSRTVLLLFLMLPVAQVRADAICSPDCSIVINFTAGGSIEAVDALTVTFGNAGVLNDGVVTTGYTAGQTYNMSAGSTLNFAAGGVLDLGDAGNIEYTDMVITFAGGDMTVSADGDVTLSGQTEFNGGDITIVAGTGVILVSGAVEIGTGTLTLNSDATVSTDGDVSLSSGVVMSGAGDLAITGSATVSLGNGSTLTSTAGEISLNTVSVLSTGTLVIMPASQDIVAQDFVDGNSYVTDDGNVCTVSSGQCLTRNGDEYVVESGKFVLAPVAIDSSSSLGSVFVISLCCTLLGLRRRQTFRHPVVLNLIE